MESYFSTQRFSTQQVKRTKTDHFQYIPKAIEMKKDTIYQTDSFSHIAPFEFNQEVVQVFEDMISRSVPSYRASIELAMILATEICSAGDHVYDLGCSLGAASFALLHQKAIPQLNITAVDIAKPMLQELASRLQQLHHIQKPINQQPTITHQFPFIIDQFGPQQHYISLELQDITTMHLKPCQLALCNYVLQFITLEDRISLLKRIYNQMPKGGALLLSEKIIHEDQQQQTMLDRLHLQFKRLQGYSEMEIHAKRTALENILIPETIAAHEARLKTVGFTEIILAVSQLNFASLIAIK